MPLASGQFEAIGSNLNVAAITTPAPLLHDKVAGDTTTGYSNTGANTTRALTALIVGLGPMEVSSLDVTAQGTGDISNTAQLHSSPDGTTWTLRKAIAATMTGAIQRFQQAVTSATVLNWRLTVIASMSDNLTVGTAAIFDYRLFDSSGNEYTYDAGSQRFIKANPAVMVTVPPFFQLFRSAFRPRPVISFPIPPIAMMVSSVVANDAPDADDQTISTLTGPRLMSFARPLPIQSVRDLDDETDSEQY